MPSLKSKVTTPFASASVVGVLMLCFWKIISKHTCPVDLPGKTLVVHIFADTDPEYLENLNFFVHHGILKGDVTAEYVIIVQSNSTSAVRLRCCWLWGFSAESPIALCCGQVARLPILPTNARYILHKNECYDWGAVGWLLLRSGKIHLSRFKYFVVTNSSVRGPFLPPYIPVRAGLCKFLVDLCPLLESYHFCTCWQRQS